MNNNLNTLIGCQLCSSNEVGILPGVALRLLYDRADIAQLAGVIQLGWFPLRPESRYLIALKEATGQGSFVSPPYFLILTSMSP